MGGQARRIIGEEAGWQAEESRVIAVAKRDRIAEITEKKQRGQKAPRRFLWEFGNLQKHWERVRATNADADDFFIIRAVTLLEVFSRDYIARLIDSGSPYAENAIPLGADMKIDIALVRAIQGRVVTLGDMIAHNVSISSFGHICSAFKTLLGDDLVPMISTVVRKIPSWKPKEVPKAIISDVKLMSKRLARLFEIRNILCHEFPRKEVYDRREITPFLSASEEFASATSIALDRLIEGDVPETMEGRIELAERELKEEEKVLAEVFQRIDSCRDKRRLRLRNKAQRTWEVFRQAQCAYSAASYPSATQPLLMALEGSHLTQQRIESLRRFLHDEDDE
jgi:uncharacterized protein YecT (DUF1311 family)